MANWGSFGLLRVPVNHEAVNVHVGLLLLGCIGTSHRDGLRCGDTAAFSCCICLLPRSTTCPRNSWSHFRSEDCCCCWSMMAERRLIAPPDSSAVGKRSPPKECGGHMSVAADVADISRRVRSRFSFNCRLVAKTGEAIRPALAQPLLDARLIAHFDR